MIRSGERATGGRRAAGGGGGGGRADLHTHTTASDGLRTPAEVVAMAAALGLAAVGITDHDSVDGLAEAAEAGRRHGIEVVPGVELNTDVGGGEVHVLGYYCDAGHPALREALERARLDREGRGQAMVERLRRLGYPLEFARVVEIAGGAPIGRPHVARAMIEHGYVATVAEAFDRFLSPGGPAYIKRHHMTPMEAVRLVLAAGGVPVLAHPGLYGGADLLPELLAAGLRGLEVRHPGHGENDVRRYEAAARRFGLIPTGGSDSHGPGKGPGDGHAEIGSVTVPAEVVDLLKAAREEIRAVRA